MKNQKILEIVDRLLRMGKDNTEWGCILCNSDVTFDEYFDATTIKSKWTDRKNLEAGIYAYLTDEELHTISVECDVAMIDNSNGGNIYFWQA